MQAIRIHNYGNPAVMQLETLPTPVPGREQVLVQVQAASVNFIDIQHRRGDLAAQAFYNREGSLETGLPTTLGSQGIGIVEKIGPDVTNVKVGDCVNFYARSYATHALVPSDRLIPVPDGISLEVAAA